jgi:drug/metabolite transporter (DMT)-like permease
LSVAIVVVTNSIQPAFTGISSFFFVTNQKITLAIGLAAAIVILIAGGVWFVRDQPGEQPGVTLAFASQPTNGGSEHATFRLYNDSTRAIFLSWMVVQTKTPG